MSLLDVASWSRFVTFEKTLKCWLCAVPMRGCGKATASSGHCFTPSMEQQHQGDVYTILIQAPTCQGTKTSWKCQVHMADSSLTGSSCTGCHLRVTGCHQQAERIRFLPAGSRKPGQSGLGFQNCRSLRQAVPHPSRRDGSKFSGIGHLLISELWQQLELVFKRAPCPLGKSETPREVGKGKGQTAPSLSLSHVWHFQCCKSTRLCVHTTGTDLKHKTILHLCMCLS